MCPVAIRGQQTQNADSDSPNIGTAAADRCHEFINALVKMGGKFAMMRHRPRDAAHGDAVEPGNNKMNFPRHRVDADEKPAETGNRNSIAGATATASRLTLRANDQSRVLEILQDRRNGRLVDFGQIGDLPLRKIRIEPDRMENPRCVVLSNYGRVQNRYLTLLWLLPVTWKRRQEGPG